MESQVAYLIYFFVILYDKNTLATIDPISMLFKMQG